jgi:DNA polymerase-1
MIKAFLNNEDIHKSTASKVFDVPLEEVTRAAMRKRLI